MKIITLGMTTILLFSFLQHTVHTNTATMALKQTGAAWRDSFTISTVSIKCTDKNGNPVAGAKITFSITNPGTIAGAMSGITDSKGQVSIMVRSTDLSTDDALTTVNATCGSVTNSIPVIFKGALRIILAGSNITNKTTHCMVGERQLLAVQLLSDTNLTHLIKATWSASGATPINNWTPNIPASSTTSFPPDSNSYPSINLYLTTAGNDTTRLLAAVKDYTGNTVIGTAATTFNVTAPTDCKLTAIVNRTKSKSKCVYSGISFIGTGGAGGQLSLAQIVNSMKQTINGVDEPILDDRGKTVVFPGLDNVYPYDKTAASNDSPGYYLCDTHNTIPKLSVSMGLTMYLMWTSNKSGSIDIPLRKVTWRCRGDIDFINRKWIIDQPNMNGNTLSDSAVTCGVLTWQNVISNLN